MRLKSYLPYCAALLSCCVIAPAHAQWATKGELGLVIASGNTDTKAANVKLALGYKVDNWAHAGTFAAVYAAAADLTTAQRYELGEQSQYAFNPRNFWFGGLRYEDDRFSGFDYQGTLSTGLGHKFIDTPSTTLSGQAGVGYKVAETRFSIDPDTGVAILPERSTSLAGLAGFDFKHAFNPATSLTNKFQVEATSANTFFQNQIALEVKMSTRLALALGYAIRHNTQPPDGFLKTDTLTTINIVYASP